MLWKLIISVGIIMIISIGVLLWQGGIQEDDIFYDITPNFLKARVEPAQINVSDTPSTTNNITIENNFSHLTIGDSNTGFINATNLNLYLPFDTNTSTTLVYDYSANNRDHTVVNDADYINEGLFSGGFTFDGNGDRLSLVEARGVTPINSETIAVWIKPKAGSITTSGQGIICLMGAASAANNPQFQLQTNKSNTGIRCNTATKNNGGNAGVTTGFYNLNLNQWYHTACVMDYNTGTEVMNLTLYVDGSARASTSRVIDAYQYASSHLFIGSQKTANNRYFSGDVDEVLWINYSLSSSQMLSIFNNQSSRFFPKGEQIFNNINVSETGDEDSVDITINATMNFSSMINVSVGSVSGGSYSYGAETAFIDDIASDISISTPNNISLKFIFYVGNSSTNSFISPTLEEDIIVEITEDINAVPTVLLINPLNNTDHLNITLGFNVTDTDGDYMNATIYVSNDTSTIGDYVIEVVNILNGTHQVNFSFWDGFFGNYPTGLFALYHLNNDSAYGESKTHVYDHASGMFNGTPSASPTISSGKHSGGWTFNSEFDDIDLGNDLNQTCDDGCTFCAWHKPSGFPATAGQIIGRWDDGSPIHFFVSLRHNMFYISETGASGSCTSGTGASNIGEWYHVCGVWNNSDSLFYQNGVLNGSTSCGFTEINRTSWNVDEVMLIGNTQGISGNNQNYDGVIDEVAVWNRSLNQAEISSMFKLSKGRYYWNVSVTDGQNISPSKTWEFTINDTCSYTSGDWDIDCRDDCEIDENVTIDSGSNISMIRYGTFTISNNTKVKNWDYRRADQECYYQAYGTGGFFQ